MLFTKDEEDESHPAADNDGVSTQQDFRADTYQVPPDTASTYLSDVSIYYLIAVLY